MVPMGLELKLSYTLEESQLNLKQLAESINKWKVNQETSTILGCKINRRAKGTDNANVFILKLNQNKASILLVHPDRCSKQPLQNYTHIKTMESIIKFVFQ
jgi:hypothetical protein